MSERLDDARRVDEQLRQTIREAHAATGDLRRATRELNAALAQARKAVSDEFDVRAEAVVAAGIASYSETITTKIDEASNAVLRRFDTLTAALMGEAKRVQGETIPDFIARVIEARDGYAR